MMTWVFLSSGHGRSLSMHDETTLLITFILIQLFQRFQEYIDVTCNLIGDQNYT